METFFAHFFSAEQRRTITIRVLASDPADAEQKAKQRMAADYPGHHWNDVVVNDVANEKGLPKQRLADEIMKLLIKRQTSLADGIDALTRVQLNALKAKYGREKADEFDLLVAHFYEEVRGFSESMKRDRFCIIPHKRFPESMERDRVSTLHSVSLKRLWHRIGQALARAGTNLRNKLGHGGGFEGAMVDKERPERVRHLEIEIGELVNKHRPSLGDGLDALTGVMLTAIEATHGREKADQFDLLWGRFSAEVFRFSGVRVQ